MKVYLSINNKIIILLVLFTGGAILDSTLVRELMMTYFRKKHLMKLIG
ncbi:hypothetical protein KHA80_16110 [Anaerobacillus sp. HL2]|nr:hypothetical protein KHA80_16110 [Anaerobacillus sp. HL2]